MRTMSKRANLSTLFHGRATPYRALRLYELSVDSAPVLIDDHLSLSPLLRGVKDGIRYAPKVIVTDDDRAWKAAVTTVFPDVSIQLCVVHFESVADEVLPKRKRTLEQEEFKGLVRRSSTHRVKRLPREPWRRCSKRGETDASRLDRVPARRWTSVSSTICDATVPKSSLRPEIRRSRTSSIRSTWEAAFHSRSNASLGIRP